MRRPAGEYTVRHLIEHGAQLLDEADVWFGHGTDNAFDEAAELVFFACDLRHEDAEHVYDHALSAAQSTAALALIQRRIEERLPAAYLTHRMWFAGHEFYVDERVLVPRSPIAELIETQFAPWLNVNRIQRVLDIGTGSGCIAIATALTLPDARVDAVDVSDDALAVAALNVERHDLATRVRLIKSDVYEQLGSARYDLILANPPYVGEEEMKTLPTEYAREPRIGLEAPENGLAIVQCILQGARERLLPGGVLICEVGNSEAALLERYPMAPFIWLDFERGGGGVFVLTEEQLAECDFGEQRRPDEA